jgi:DNA-binding IclR family transcriptional regulator
MGIDNEEYIDGMVGCSVPIKNEDGQFIASLYTHVPVVRKSLEELKVYEPLLRQAAAEISDLVNSPVMDSGE